MADESLRVIPERDIEHELAAGQKIGRHSELRRMSSNPDQSDDAASCTSGKRIGRKPRRLQWSGNDPGSRGHR